MGSLSLLQGIFPSKGIKPGSPALQADSLPTEQINYTPIKHNLEKKETSWALKSANIGTLFLLL